MNITLIAAIGKNYELGYQNELLWHIKEDLQFFKKQTIGKTIVMGRKTFESLPGILPERKHIVLARSQKNFPEGVIIFSSLDTFLANYQNNKEEIMIIGGASIYEQFIDYASKMYLTEIEDTKQADAYFPHFNKAGWEKETLSTHQEKKLVYHHNLYQRKK